MSPVETSLVVFACVLGGALGGMALRGVLPEDHRGTESKELIRSTMALIGTISALVLGLLVASAKSTYDASRDEVTGAAANVLLLDRILAHYGPEAQPSRVQLRDAISGAVDEIWHGSKQSPGHFDRLYDTISDLAPKTESQKRLQDQAGSILIDLGRSRWRLYTRSGTSISTPLLVIVVFWLTLNFMSFGLFASRNTTVLVALFVGALSVAGAVYLILEMDSPFRGLLQISETPLRSVLEQIAR